MNGGRIRTLTGFSVFALALVLGTGAAQDTLRVDVQLVTVVATVTDAEGRYVSGLTVDDFVVEDNGAVQQIVHFTEDRETPVSLGIVLDTSSSMARRMRTALGAIDRFIRTLHPDDEVFLATFSDDVRMVEDLTRDRERLSRALESIREAGGTALYDALVRGLERVHEGGPEKRAILLLTDGADGASTTSLNETLSRLQRAEVLVYALGIEPVRSDTALHVPFNWPITPIPGARALPRMRALDQPVNMNVLERFATASGGETYRVSGTWTDGTIDDVDRILDEVAAELRSQYTLAYYPPTTPGGGFHTIRVRVPETDYTVRARNGYRAAN